MKFQVPSQIESVATRVDGTIKIVIGTQEVIPEEAAKLFSLKGKLGWMLFSENSFSEEDIPKEQAPEFKTDKTPAQRLRAVLYRYWESGTNRSKPFDHFYGEWIEKKINEIKDHLPQ